MSTETHWGVRYTAKADGGSNITDHETDEDSARRDCARVRPEWPYTAELLKRTVRVSPWRVVGS